MNKSSKEVVSIDVQAVLPIEKGSIALFMGNREKCFVIHVDKFVGHAIARVLNKEKSQRPLTHDLIEYILKSFTIDIDHVVLNEIHNDTYHARIILRAENKIHKKTVEIDTRPSDSIILALQADAPIFIAKDVWDKTEDMSKILEEMKKIIREENSSEEEEAEKLFEDQIDEILGEEKEEK